MKDALGHGSNARGAANDNVAAHQFGVTQIARNLYHYIRPESAQPAPSMAFKTPGKASNDNKYPDSWVASGHHHYRSRYTGGLVERD